MKKIIQKGLAVVTAAILGITPAMPVMAGEEQTADMEQILYVAPDGSDTEGTGTEDHPFASIYKAKEAVRELNRDMAGKIIVYFRGGNYTIDRTVQFGPEDSGTNGYDIEYKAYPGETPVLNGGVKVEGWQKDPDHPNLYVAELDRDKKLRTLYVNDRRAYMPSRTLQAKGGYGTHTIVKGEGEYAWEDQEAYDGVKFNPSDLPSSVRNPEDIEVQSSMTWNTMTAAARGIREADGMTVVLLEQPYGVIAQKCGWAYYRPSGENVVFNVFEFLDEPGEFYFDKKEKKLYYYPWEGEDMETAEVYAPQTDTLIRVEGEDLKTHVSHITFDGLTVEHSDWMMQEIAGSHGKVATQASLSLIGTYSDHHALLYRCYDLTAAAVEVTSADHISFLNGTFRHTANDTVNMINDVADCEVTGNRIYDTGAGAISIGHPQHMYIGDKGSAETMNGTKPWNLKSDKEKFDVDVEGLCHDIRVTNNYMRDLSRLWYGSPGMTIFFGTDLLVEHNEMENTPYSGISLGWGWGYTSRDEEGAVMLIETLKNNKIRNNRIYDTVNVLADGGAIYTLSPMEGTEISNNYLSKVGQNGYHSRGIHVDEGTMYLHGDNNVIEVREDQAAIDCGKWGPNPKGQNAFDNNYTTTSLYTTTGNYEPGTTMTNKHINKSGMWSEEEPISIIRNAGLEDQYLSLMEDRIQDVVLPTDYRLPPEVGITQISVPDVDGEIWLAPEGTEEFTESSTVIRAQGGTLAIPEEKGSYRVYYVRDGKASEPSRGQISTDAIPTMPPRTDVIGPYWVDDVENHQGTNGNVETADFGISQNTNDASNVFGINRDGLSLSYKRINGVDGGSGGWTGYVEKEVTLDRGGDYTVYVLCFGAAGRRFRVSANGSEGTVTDEIVGITDSGSGKAISSDNCLNVLQVALELKKGSNTIHIQGEGAGPNFVAMGLVKAEIGSAEIPTDGLQLWLRADKGVTVSKDGTVTTWKDQSGNGHDAGSAVRTVGSGTAETDPEYVEQGENQEPAVRFDGKDDILEFEFEDVLAGKEDATVILVSRNTSGLSGKSQTNVNGDTNGLLYFHDTEAWGKFVLTPYEDVVSVRMPERCIYTAEKSPDDIGINLSTTVFVKEGTTATLYDKDSIGIHTNGNVPLTLHGVDDTVGYLGGYHGSDVNLFHFTGDICEVMIFDKALPLGAVQAVNAYLNEKYYEPKPQKGDEIELTGDLDIFDGEQDQGVTLPGPASKNKYVKQVFGSGGWQQGGSYAYGVNVDYRAAFDGTEEDVGSYFDGAMKGYCGVEFKEPQIITKIGFQARNGARRLDGAILQGSDDGRTYTNLYTIQNSSDSEMRYVEMEQLQDQKAYRYIRLMGPEFSVLNLYELKLYTTVGIGEEPEKESLKFSDITVEEGKMTYAVSSTVSAPSDLYVALYDDAGALVGVRKGESGTFEDIRMHEQYRLCAFAWKQGTMVPACEKAEKAMKAEVTMDAYLFVHFVGTEKNPEDEQVYFSVSKDAHQWETVNGGKPVLVSNMGEKGIRDMHIIRSVDGNKFYLIGTDLSMYYNHKNSDGSPNWGHASSHGSRSINIWESDDLVHWSEQRQALIAPSDAGMAWAPESIYDQEKESYMVFWASTTTVDGVKKTRIYAAYTKDYRTFTEPEIYQELPGNVIDTTIYYDGNRYYRFYKYNNTVYGEYADSLHAETWTSTGLAIARNEGPEVFRFNKEEKWGLLVDAEQYTLYTTDDLGAGSFQKEEMNTDTVYRHGSVIPITKKEYEAIKQMGSQEE